MVHESPATMGCTVIPKKTAPAATPTPEPTATPDNSAVVVVAAETTNAPPAPPPAQQLQEPEQVDFVKDLVVLPPRQKKGWTVPDKQLRLPPIRALEPVQSLRGALSELVDYAAMTNYRLELESSTAAGGASKSFKKSTKKGSSSSGGGGGGSKNKPVVSPYTGPNAVVAVPHQLKSLEMDPSVAILPSSSSVQATADVTDAPVVLDDYGDLAALGGLLQDGSAFGIVLERYDAATVRDHVGRLRNLLDGNAPSAETLVDEEPAAAVPAAPVEEPAKEQETAIVSEKDKNKVKQVPLPALPVLTADEVKMDGTKLRDFFYHATGEDPELYHGTKRPAGTEKKKKKGKKSNKDDDKAAAELPKKPPPEQLVREKMPRLNELEEVLHVACTIRYSGFHPPPAARRGLGDIAYLEITPPGQTGAAIFVTAVATGFYVNKSTVGSGGRAVFDPSPAAKSCFSHTLLDCLLQASKSFQEAWVAALAAAKERLEILSTFNESPFVSLFRVAIRGDFGGFQSPATAAIAQEQLDATLITPSWLSPLPRQFTADTTWNRNAFHAYNPSRTDDDTANSFGIDVRNGGVRDWNEELQVAREMSTDSLDMRIERARLIHRVMTDFGEASLVGVKAISEGQIASMNPNEPTRSQVYLHNNIFFSRALDAGPETFKIAKGDKAARKTANRDVQCISIFHRMERSGLNTLATVLIDYLGTRFVCQSILPGILTGEKSHTLLYGTVEAGVPITWDEDFHKILSDKIGEGMMVASRPVLRSPLTAERMEEIQQLKKASPLAELEKPEESKETFGPDEVVESCVPLEAKGILGSDQRKYVLDFGRLTPRDANWVGEDKGGTGKWEAARKQGKSSGAIPSSLDDDEWVVSVLRPELVTRYTQHGMSMYLKNKKEKKLEEEKAKAEADEGSGEGEKVDKAQEEEAAKLTEEDLVYLKTLRLNVNVFLPDIRSFDGINEDAAEQAKNDQLRAADAAVYLWDEVLPQITKAIKDGSVYQLPVDGKSLTEFIHRNGVNCRYMGKLATLAAEQEEKDAKVVADLEKGRLTVVERRTMPKSWLELLECEMVARAAKHVLDSYLTENGGVGATQPAAIISSVLSALVSETEETAAQTETRTSKRSAGQPDEDDVGALTISGTGGDGDAVPTPTRSRYEIWQDIELEVGRRFRYSLTLYNTGGKSARTLYIPLLRRVCQRTGVRLLAKDYDVAGKCLCDGGSAFGGRLTASYPISPLDVVDVVPLMKHAAAHGEGFVPCSVSPSITLPPLHVSLPDARMALERAHIQTSSRTLGRGLELAQEAASLYQRVTDSACHPGVLESMELMANIFLEAGEPALAAANATKQLGLAVQSGGFDSAAVFSTHMSLFQMLYTCKQMDEAVKHLRAGIYLLEIMSGPNHTEHFSAYHKLGTVYSDNDYNGKYLSTSLKLFQEASERDACDRLMSGFTSRNLARAHAGLGQYKDALELEKKAYRTFSLFAGKEHEVTKSSDEDLKKYTKLAVQKGTKMIENEKLREEEARATKLADELFAEEDKVVVTKKSKGKQKKGKK